MKVHKCDGHAKVDCALMKSMFRIVENLRILHCSGQDIAGFEGYGPLLEAVS